MALVVLWMRCSADADSRPRFEDVYRGASSRLNRSSLSLSLITPNKLIDPSFSSPFFPSFPSFSPSVDDAAGAACAAGGQPWQLS